MIQPRIICVDADGTCFTHEFPYIGRDIGAVPVLRELVAAGHKLILWTMRSDGRTATTARNGQPLHSPNPLTDAVNWFKRHDIALWAVNRNPEQDKWTSSPKSYGQLYIDDAALGAPLIDNGVDRPYLDWNAVRDYLVKHNYLQK